MHMHARDLRIHANNNVDYQASLFVCPAFLAGNTLGLTAPDASSSWSTWTACGRDSAARRFRKPSLIDLVHLRRVEHPRCHPVGGSLPVISLRTFTSASPPVISQPASHSGRHIVRSIQSASSGDDQNASRGGM